MRLCLLCFTGHDAGVQGVNCVNRAHMRSLVKRLQHKCARHAKMSSASMRRVMKRNPVLYSPLGINTCTIAYVYIYRTLQHSHTEQTDLHAAQQHSLRRSSASQPLHAAAQAVLMGVDVRVGALALERRQQLRPPHARAAGQPHSPGEQPEPCLHSVLKRSILSHVN